MTSLIDLITSAPQKMVFISTIALFMFLLTIFFYTKIFPKKKIPYPVVLLGFSILPLISIFRPGSYESGDLTLHTARLVSFYQSLSEGNLIPRWAGELNATYGYALFNFIYPLPYYISSFFHFLGFSLLDSVKILLGVTYVLSGFSTFIWLKNHFPPKHALVGAVFYLYAPYHLVDMHFRVDVGEMTAFVFLPLALYCIDKIIQRGTFLWVFLGGLFLTLLVLSHPAISLAGFGVLITYSIYFSWQKNMFYKLKTFLSLLLGLLFSAYYWIPVFLESNFTHGATTQVTLEFHKLREFLFSPWRNGLLFQGPNGELSYIIGYVQLIVVLIALYLLLIKKYRSKFLIFFLASFTLTFLLLQKFTEPIWYFTPIQKMLLTYRLLAIIMLTTSALAAFISTRINKKSLYLLVFLAVVTTILNWGNRRNIPEIKDLQIIAMVPTISAEGECFWPAIHISNVSKAYCRTEIPSSHLEPIDTDLFILNEKRFTNYHYYLVKSKKGGAVRENTDYYPGWKVYINGEVKSINENHPKFPGIITFSIDKGISRIELTYEDTNIRKAAFLISVVSLFLSSIYLIFSSHLKTKLGTFRKKQPKQLNFRN